MAHQFDISSDAFTIRIAGPLNQFDAQEIRNRLSEIMGSGRKVVLDLEHCDFLDSAAMGFITLLQKEFADQGFHVVNVQGQPAKLLQLASLDTVIDIHFLEANH